jgi:NADP-dependent 3-hydroxy acid dehydrogenase YdfG
VTAPGGAPATPLAGRSAVVTGASRGVGLAVARRLAGAGARVALLARSADLLAREAAALDHGAFAVPCDLTSRTAVSEAVCFVCDELEGPPDVLVNNAGLFTVAPAHELSADDFADTVDTNLVAPFTLLRGFLPAMRKRGRGHVVTIGSVADRAAFPENAAYAASKYGLRALHEVVRLELRGTGVRATLVSPGPTDTPLWDPHDPGGPAGKFPPRSAMLPADAVADAVLFALSLPPEVNVDELRLSRS